MDTDIFEFIRGLRLVGPARADDDFFDRLSHYYTVSILILFTVLISAKQYMGSPLQCWIPQHYQKSWGQYAENYCWVKNTYFVHNDIPADRAVRKEAEINYYQWVPFVLALQALLFYFPSMVWRLANWQTGIDVHEIVAAACAAASSSDHGERKEVVVDIADHINETVKLTKGSKTGPQYYIKRTFFCMCSNQKFGRFLSVLYLIIKLLYCCNIMLQFYLLNAFLGTGDVFGVTLLHELIQGRQWHESALFPRVTFCDFKIRALAQDRPQTIQCVLPINLFNEKIYIFLWFWFLLVAVLTFLSTLWWFYRTLHPVRPITFIKRYLKLVDVTPHEREIKDFIRNKLFSDGIFLLRLMSSNAGSQVTTEIVHALWKKRDEIHE